MDRWYALTVKPRHEFRVLEGLSLLNGAEGFVPTYPDKRLWSDRVKVLDVPLFTGYVFARFKADSLRMPVLKLGGVKSIVGFGGDPMALADSEIESVRALAWSRRDSRCVSGHFLPAGQRVRVEHGPLKGAEGVILSQKDVWMMVVTIELLQRSVAVELDRSVLRAIRGDEA